MNILPRRGEYQVVVTESDNPGLYRPEHPDSIVRTTSQNDLLHGIGDEPAVVVYNKQTGSELERAWFKDGERHRDNDLPARIYDNGDYTELEWFSNGLSTKCFTISKRTGHTVTKLYYENNPKDKSSCEDGEEFTTTVDHYDEESGEHINRTYSSDFDHVASPQDLPKHSFPNPSP